MEENLFDYKNDETNLRDELLRYISFWPYLLILLLFSVIVAFTYIRYATFTYKTSSVIEIVDEAQSNEMALPTELTVFNRSMINLQNEINILKSFNLNKSNVKSLNSNVHYFRSGLIKRKSRLTPQDWYDNYQLEFKIDTDSVSKLRSFEFEIENEKLTISAFDNEGNLINSKRFNSLTTLNKAHDFPFEITISTDNNDLFRKRHLVLNTVNDEAAFMKKSLEVVALGNDSDQLSLSLTFPNHQLAAEYLEGIMYEFDMDGIKDRQLEYLRTIEFVDVREKILKADLEIIELKKQNYKQDNSVTNINLDADNNIDLKYSYDSEIFTYESQKQIANYLLESISDSESDYLPINIGLENFDLNNMIQEHNKIVAQRDKYLNDAGNNNILVRSLQSQLERITENISSSLESFLVTIELKLEKLRIKENEFNSVYNRVPVNEKTLRSIERELSIKEALYLLLLQKREEASINLAVVRPSIKIIDNSRVDMSSKSPNSLYVLIFAILASFGIYLILLYFWFLIDNKVHNKLQLSKLLNEEIPIIGEIPYVKKDDINFSTDSNYSNSRTPLSESIRMLISNLKFTSSQFANNQKDGQTIVVTSSIKGEGKTLISANIALNLSNDLEKNKKTILLGSDLRNPQIHKIFGVSKTQKGISEIIYKKDNFNLKKYIKSFQNLDVLFSGTIPPNPTSMLGSREFKNLISLLKKEYDYIIIDSAPCILVSDTFQFIDLIDSTIYIFRASYSEQNIVKYINELHEGKKIKNLNLVLNAVGNSSAYGYRYGYQYGYGYKYAYNYGYGYGYNVDDGNE